MWNLLLGFGLEKQNVSRTVAGLGNQEKIQSFENLSKLFSQVVQCLRSDCDNVGNVDDNLSRDMIAKEVQSVPPWRMCRSKGYEGVSKE